MLIKKIDNYIAFVQSLYLFFIAKSRQLVTDRLVLETKYMVENFIFMCGFCIKMNKRDTHTHTIWNVTKSCAAPEKYKHTEFS